MFLFSKILLEHFRSRRKTQVKHSFFVQLSRTEELKKLLSDVVIKFSRIIEHSSKIVVTIWINKRGKLKLRVSIFVNYILWLKLTFKLLFHNKYILCSKKQLYFITERIRPPTTHDFNSLTPTTVIILHILHSASSLDTKLAKSQAMFSPEYEKRLLKHCSPTARRLFSAPESSSPSDRFIPCRLVIAMCRTSRQLITYFQRQQQLGDKLLNVDKIK